MYSSRYLFNIVIFSYVSLIFATEDKNSSIIGPENVPETTTDTLKTVNIPTIKDMHHFYKSWRSHDPLTAQHYWIDLDDKTDAKSLTYDEWTESQRAVIIPLPFEFQLYGEKVDNVTITPLGFLYTGHSNKDEYYSALNLATTKPLPYIAPLLAWYFDTSLLNDSYVKYAMNSTTLTVMWENIILLEGPEIAQFTFQVTLCEGGDIIFVYKNIPDSLNLIPLSVKIGLSDVYIYKRKTREVSDKDVMKATLIRTTKTCLYHRLNFVKTELKSWSVIYLTPLPTRYNKAACESCLSKTSKCSHWCYDGPCLITYTVVSKTEEYD